MLSTMQLISIDCNAWAWDLTWWARQHRSMSGGGISVVLPCRRCRCKKRRYRCAARARNQCSL
jgi:hypothetical protein